MVQIDLIGGFEPGNLILLFISHMVQIDHQFKSIIGHDNTAFISHMVQIDQILLLGLQGL